MVSCKACSFTVFFQKNVTKEKEKKKKKKKERKRVIPG